MEINQENSDLRLIVVVLALCGLGVCMDSNASVNRLTTEAKQLKSAYENLMQRKRDPQRQKAYLDAFPSTAKSFNRLFNNKKRDQLWDGNQYIFELERLAQSNSKATFALVFDLATSIPWGPDAPNYLQFVLMKIALDNPFEFARHFEQLKQQRQSSLIRFLTTSKNGPAIGYKELIYVLRRTNKNDVADALAAGLK